MFCPQCGQHSPDEIRFCPRCGLSLLPHAALLAAGHQTAPPLSTAPAPVMTRRRISSRRAAKLMFFSVVLSPIFIALSIGVEGGEPLLLPFFTFLAGLAWLIYARLFVDDIPHAARPPSPRDLRGAGDRPALGAQQFVPASSFNQPPPNTAEIVPPPSVTEHSTRLLDRDT